MQERIKNIVVLGGGSAGWLTAGVIAAEHQGTDIHITLIESEDRPPVGVGEGTWPTMRATLKKIGIAETEFFKACEASFKQGAKFSGWVSGEKDDHYYHPLVLPAGFKAVDTVGPWQRYHRSDQAYGDAVCFQGALCEAGCAPKLIKTPEYEAVANYAYHLSSEKLGILLRAHCTQKLGVKHLIDHVTAVESNEDGDIQSLLTRHNGELPGDLFIDCSGFSSRLLGEHYNVPFIDKSHILFNDRALAVQVPYPETDSPIASHTISTAYKAGWVWDIGLPTRRGVGSVYSSAHCSDDEAHQQLQAYVAESIGLDQASRMSYRNIKMRPGHREKFWHRNCVAVGMSAGFLEPLEASALVLVELSAVMISQDLPVNKQTMASVACRFNQRFSHHWATIIDFLKLHYVLSKRVDSDYWLDHKQESSVPLQLQAKLALWQYQVPNKYDFPLAEEMFPTASWLYVLYGMGFRTEDTREPADEYSKFEYFYNKTQSIKKQLLSQLPTNRELIEKIHQYGLQRV